MKFYIIILIFLSLSHANDFITTRLMSTGGTGVGSILLNESNLFNPSTIAFFKNNSVYYQKYKAKLQDANNQRQIDQNDYPSDKVGHLFIVADTSTDTPGSFGYMTYKDVNYNRKRFNFSFAKPVGKDSSIGVILRKTKDYYLAGSEDEYYQTVLGITHIINEQFSFGFVLNDPFKTRSVETSMMLGMQYIISQHLYFISDFGGYYTDSISENSIFRNAFQIRFLEDFYVRFGLFQDKNKGTKGDGWGFSWVSPKLTLDFATMTTKDVDSTKSFIYQDETIIETSFTISVVM